MKSLYTGLAWDPLSNYICPLTVSHMDTLHTHIHVYLFILCQYFKFIYRFTCMVVLAACMFVNHVHVCYPRRLEETVRSPGTEVIVISYHMGARNRDPLEKQSV